MNFQIYKIVLELESKRVNDLRRSPSQAAEDETVTWMPEAADQVTEETVGHEEVPLTPAQVGTL